MLLSLQDIRSEVQGRRVESPQDFVLKKYLKKRGYGWFKWGHNRCEVINMKRGVKVVINHSGHFPRNGVPKYKLLWIEVLVRETRGAKTRYVQSEFFGERRNAVIAVTTDATNLLLDALNYADAQKGDDAPAKTDDFLQNLVLESLKAHLKEAYPKFHVKFGKVRIELFF